MTSHELVDKQIYMEWLLWLCKDAKYTIKSSLSSDGILKSQYLSEAWHDGKVIGQSIHTIAYNQSVSVEDLKKEHFKDLTLNIKMSIANLFAKALELDRDGYNLAFYSFNGLVQMCTADIENRFVYVYE